MADVEYGAYVARSDDQRAPRYQAYPETEGYDAAPAPHIGFMGRTLSYFGAFSSIALIAGLGIWGYQLTMRDVTDVPVIRALEGPSRIQPDDPGGQLAEHQGLAVNSVQAEGEAEGPAPQIILAPEPIDLTTEDVVLAAPEEGTVPTGTATDELAETIGTVVSLSLQEQALTPEEQAELLAARLADGTDPIFSEPVPEPAVERLDTSVPGVNLSLRPVLRPRVDLKKLQETAASAAASGSIEPIVDADPAKIVSGTRLVQLGAFDDEITARAEWDKIAAGFSDYMDGKRRLVQEAKSGGRTFYRLRAVGFDDLNASRRFCAVLVAANAACIPVLAK